MVAVLLTLALLPASLDDVGPSDAAAEPPVDGDASAVTTQPPSGATLVVAVQPAVGLSDGEVTALLQRILDELQAAGLRATRGGAVDPACVADAACVEAARQAMPDAPDALLVVEMIRVGPVVQLTATGAAGDDKVNASQGIEEAAPVLPDAVAVWARGVEPARAAPPPPPPPPVETAGPLQGLTPMKTGALFAGGIGVVALVTGVVLVSTSEPVLNDQTSSGKEKQNAVALGWTGVGAAGVGVAAAAAAAALWLLE